MVSIIITTHGKLATTFLDVAESVLGKQEAVVAVDVMPQEGKEEILQHLTQAVSRVQQQDGVLILAGIFGEGDCQISLSLFRGNGVRVVTGLNLPMLLKVLTHRSKLNLNALAASACESGKAGIIDCGLDPAAV